MLRSSFLYYMRRYWEIGPNAAYFKDPLKMTSSVPCMFLYSTRYRHTLILFLYLTRAVTHTGISSCISPTGRL